MTKEEFIKALEPLGFSFLSGYNGSYCYSNDLLDIQIYYDFDYTQESIDKVIALYHYKNNMTREQFIEFRKNNKIYFQDNQNLDYEINDCYFRFTDDGWYSWNKLKYTRTNAHKLLAIKQAADKLNDLIENTKFEEVK